MKVVPKGDRILIERILDSEKRGDLVIPEVGRKAQRGRVVAVGEGPVHDWPGKALIIKTVAPTVANPTYGEFLETTIHFPRQEMIVKVGDVVLYGQFSGVQVDVEGREFFLARQDEIIAVLEEDEVDLKKLDEDLIKADAEVQEMADRAVAEARNPPVADGADQASSV
jgi:chaperonin GroES